VATESKIGTVGWQDLTVPDAERLRDFHAAVVGWRAEPVDMTHGSA
jgi:predicted enzyme related to lactoylglutathione lyase